MQSDQATSGLTTDQPASEKPRRGRPKGVPNRVTRDVRAAAQKYTSRALTTLAKLLADADPKVRAIAARELLDRAHGKPMTPTELTGKDGAPLVDHGAHSDLELARAVTFILAKGAKEATGSIGIPLRPPPASTAAADPFANERERQAAAERRLVEVARAEVAEREEADAAAGAQWIGGRKVYPGSREEHGLAPSNPKVITRRN